MAPTLQVIATSFSQSPPECSLVTQLRSKRRFPVDNGATGSSRKHDWRHPRSSCPLPSRSLSAPQGCPGCYTSLRRTCSADIQPRPQHVLPAPYLWEVSLWLTGYAPWQIRPRESPKYPLPVSGGLTDGSFKVMGSLTVGMRANPAT